jgi:uncharacterized protein YggE
VNVATLFVTGSAEREVTPDLVVVPVRVQTPVLPTARSAPSAAAQARRRLVDHLEGALAGAAISDGRITTRQEERQVAVERPGGTETRWEAAGDTGRCPVAVEAEAGRAAEIVAAAGAHPDAERVSPAFEVSAALERSTRDELERDAVRDALARAEGLAAAAGMAVADALGELRPEPEARVAEVPVRVELLEAAGGGPPA